MARLPLNDDHLFCFSLAVFTLKKVDYIFRESYCVIAREAPSLPKLNSHSKDKSDNRDFPPKVTKDKTLASSFGARRLNSESALAPGIYCALKMQVSDLICLSNCTIIIIDSPFKNYLITDCPIYMIRSKLAENT